MAATAEDLEMAATADDLQEIQRAVTMKLSRGTSVMSATAENLSDGCNNGCNSRGASVMSASPGIVEVADENALLNLRGLRHGRRQVLTLRVLAPAALPDHEVRLDRIHLGHFLVQTQA